MWYNVMDPRKLRMVKEDTMVLFYKNSFVASVLSILGSILVMCGIMMFPEGEIFGGIVLILVGAALIFWGKNVSANKSFKKWWQQVVDANLVPEIARSTQTAIAIYNKNPQKRTLQKIAELNPAAASQIEQQLAARKTK